MNTGAGAPTRKPRKGDVLLARIEAFDERGRGVGRVQGHDLCVPRAAPGDLVRVRVLRRRRERIEAALVERIEDGPDRIEPRCAHFGACGGCSLQDLAPAAQLAGLRRLVIDSFAAHGLLDGVDVEPVLPAPQAYGYRNKMEFAFGNRRWIDASEPADAPDGFALGLHARGWFSKIVDVHACPIQDPRADPILDTARRLALELGLAPWNPHAHEGLLRHLVIRVSRTSGEILVMLVTSREEKALAEWARRLLEAHAGISTLVHGINARHADTALPESLHVLHGSGSIRETLAGLEFSISPLSFFQTNSQAAEVLLGLVVEECRLDGTELVWDLFCGTGTITLALARNCRDAVGFEISAAAVADARENAARNGLTNVRFVEGDVLAGIPGEAGPSPQVCVVDPPRAGLHPRLLPALLALAPRRLVYVSCNPASAARDLASLIPAYRIERIRPLDLFPHTPHVECVISLSRREEPG